MKRVIGVLLLSIVFNLTLFAQSTTPVGTNGALRVENNKIVNQNGAAPQLRGISFSWSLWQGRKYYNPAVVDWLSSDFNVSIIRASMGVEPEHGYLQEPALQSQLMVNVIDEAVKDGIYVLIDWHDHHSNLHLQQSKAFFADMAQRYKGVPNVIYEIWNEPTAISWDTVKNYATQVITEIRKYDPDNLIVVGSPHWDQDVDVVAANPVTGFKNIAYSFHFYASDPYHQEKLRAKADLALKMGLPLIITEWGVGEASGDGKFDRKLVKPWVQWMEDNKLSWTNWNITDKTETTALLMPGAPDNGGWTSDQLTPAGIYIRDELRELNK
ncbi:glycoside hydrolase family 5 protein [Mucilaginibacter sp. X4EP1]|uniref:glycoside hydrolase family 5 protein n=1 Tax=Mucilaginibacter sp. X4EP1 TaxID=2723092 RepID=UPI002169E206|nr:glycoside hydrolase family 5 protein [Mucilaginibacter sp. X4EP1]MCS3815572.1 endoglucanase [Mucilaginibacter sp. X4EP1]